MQPPLPSNEKFGWLFTAAFGCGAAYAFWKGATGWAAALATLAAVFFVVTIASPRRLTTLNRLWFKFGMQIGRIMSPIALGAIFFLLITPVSVATRLFGRDVLRLKKLAVNSYWVERNPTGPAPDSFKNQY
jgi:hypothetical protein